MDVWIDEYMGVWIDEWMGMNVLRSIDCDE